MVVGAGFFIIIQLLLLVEFAYSWNESWVLKMEGEEADGGSKWYYMLLGCTLFMIFGSIALTGVMYRFFCASGCGLHTFFITANLILGVILCLLSLHPKVREGRPSSGLLQSAVVMVYATYLVYSAINSSPDIVCNPLNFSDGTKAFSLILGAVFTIVSVVYSTIRTASASSDLLGTPESSSSDIEKTPLVTSTTADGSVVVVDGSDSPIEDDEVDGTSYNYTHFHLSFCLGAMYICMLLTNWVTIGGHVDDHSVDTIQVDRGMPSVWIKIVSGWITTLLYAWTLAGPVILPDRDWN